MDQIKPNRSNAANFKRPTNRGNHLDFNFE
jgi:hypothetical protein